MLDETVFDGEETFLGEDPALPAVDAAQIAEPAEAPLLPTYTPDTHYIYPRDEIAFKQALRQDIESDPVIRAAVTNFGSRKLQQDYARAAREWESEKQRLEAEATQWRTQAMRAQLSTMTPEAFATQYAQNPEFRRAMVEMEAAEQQAKQRPQAPDPYEVQAHENILAQFDNARDYLPEAMVSELQSRYMAGSIANFSPVDRTVLVRDALTQMHQTYTSQRQAPTQPPTPAAAPPPTPAAPTVNGGNAILAGMRSDLTPRMPAPQAGAKMSESSWQRLTPPQMEATLKGWNVDSPSAARRMGLISS